MPEIVLTLLIRGSLLTKKTPDVINALCLRLPKEDKGETWEVFDGTGSNGNVLDTFAGLFHGGYGRNNYYDTSTKAVEWIKEKTKNIQHSVRVNIVGYSRGCVTAKHITHKIKSNHIQFTLIDIDPVAGIFGNPRMVPSVSENVGLHVPCYAEHTVA